MKLKNIPYSSMTSTLDDENNFIKSLMTVKSSELRSHLANCKFA